MAIAVGSGQQRCMSGSGAGVGIVIVAVTKGGPAIEEQAETAFAELVAIAFQVVAAKLVDDDDDDQLGMAVVGGRESSGLHRKA